MSKPEINRIQLTEPTVIRGAIRRRGAFLNVPADIDLRDARYLLAISKARLVGSNDIKLAKARVSDAKKALKLAGDAAEDALKAFEQASEETREDLEKALQGAELAVEQAQAALTREEAALASLTEAQ